MSILKRYYFEGQIYFVTNVTNDRQRILINNADILREAFKAAHTRIPCKLVAYVFLPDHFHIIIDPGKNILSDILHRMKLSFSSRYRKKYNLYKGRIWQRRFWDHVIRNQEDLNRHLDYIHYNPVKHNYTRNPFLWAETSLHKFYEEGYYSQDWGVKNTLDFEGDYGEI